MSEIVDITVISSPVTVEVTAAAAAPVTVSVGAQAGVTASLTVAAAAVTAEAEIQSDAVTVEVTEAQPGEPGEPGEPGPAGANAEVVVLRNIPGGATALAQYIALSPAEQMSGKWFVIAK
jgi:hypothetical protein